MSGHSKWNNIKNKKGKADAARGKVFTKLGREILVAVKQGGPDPAGNSKLKDIIAKAKANNMPNDSIDRSIKKAAGEGNSANYEEITYEGYGPNGIAVIVNVATDNRNRTAADLRHIFDRAGGNLGTTGCVSYLFDQKGLIVIEKATCAMSEDDLMLLAIEAGAEDFDMGEEFYEIKTDPKDFVTVREKLENSDIKFVEADLQMIPQMYIQLDEHASERLDNLVDKLEDLEDVLEVYHNAE